MQKQQNKTAVPEVPGTYQKTPAGHKAFFPNALPPLMDLPNKTIRLIEQATYSLGQVEMCRTLLPNASLLIYSSLQNESLASSTIEGTIASPQELVLFQIGQQSQRQEKEAPREVSNYRTALEWGCEQIKTRPISVNVLLGMHALLMHEVRGTTSAGRFKVFQNAIGSQPTDTIEQAVFVPSPPEAVPGLMTDLENYINLDAQESKVVQCALAHYQFETIHPFVDGNGRVGRLLIILQMIQLELLSAPLIYPSVYFERNRQDYYKRLQGIRDNGEWNPWIEFFANGIVEQCKKTLDFTQTILGLRQTIQAEVAHVTRRAAITGVIDAFFRAPVGSIADIAKSANMSINSAQGAVDILKMNNLVIELTGKSWGRVYACRPVINAIFGRDPDQDIMKDQDITREPHLANGGATEHA